MLTLTLTGNSTHRNKSTLTRASKRTGAESAQVDLVIGVCVKRTG